MATTSYSFTDIVDFTRATAATYVNSSGLVTVTPTSKNILTYSQSFTNWTALRTTVTPNITTAPNGQMLASKLTDNSEATAHVITLSPTSPVSGGVYTFSAYVKKNTHPYVYLSLYNTTNAYVSAVFNLDTGAVTQTGVGSSVNVALVTTNITNEGSGWFRISITGVITSGTIANVYIGFAPYSTGNTYGGSGQISYSGNGTNSFYVWGAQLEPTSYNNLTLGVERVVGGNFESGLIGTKTDGGTPTSVSTYTLNTVSPISGTQDGKVTITTATTGSWPRITGIPSATKTIGTVYLLSFDYVVLSGAMVIDAVYNGSTTSSNVAGTSYTGSGKFQMLYTARGTTASEGIYFGNSLCSVQIDNFSVKQVTGLTGYPTSYTKNFGSIYPPRFDYDPVTLQPKGLLIEESRTNSLLYSTDLSQSNWGKFNVDPTYNITIAPDGTNTADLIIDSATTAQHYFYQSISTTSGTSYSVSFYAKNAGNNQCVFQWPSSFSSGTATFNLITGTVSVTGAGSATMTAVGNNWYRCTATNVATTTGSGNPLYFSLNGIASYLGSGTGGVYFWGFQSESGAFATSYIPTIASTATRNADVAIVFGTLFSTFYNQTNSTVIASADSNVNISALTAYTPCTFNDGTINNYFNTYVYNGKWGGASKVSGVFQFDISVTGSYTPTTAAKTGIAIASNNFACSVNGSAALTDTSGSIPTVDRLSVGNFVTGGYLNGHIRNIKYYPSRLTNAQIQALTV